MCSCAHMCCACPAFEPDALYASVTMPGHFQLACYSTPHISLGRGELGLRERGGEEGWVGRGDGGLVAAPRGVPRSCAWKESGQVRRTPDPTTAHGCCRSYSTLWLPQLLQQMALTWEGRGGDVSQGCEACLSGAY
jgi:hypothetical protein